MPGKFASQISTAKEWRGQVDKRFKWQHDHCRHQLVLQIESVSLGRHQLVLGKIDFLTLSCDHSVWFSGLLRKNSKSMCAVLKYIFLMVFNLTKAKLIHLFCYLAISTRIIVYSIK